MSLRRTRAVIVKEFKHIRLDPGFLFLTVFSPAVLLTLLSYVFSFDVDKADLALWDQDRSPQSAEYIRALTADGDVSLVAQAASYDDILDLFRASRAATALVIPPGFGSALAAREQASVNLVIDGSDAGSALQVNSSIEQRTLSYISRLYGAPPAPFDVRIRIWFNDNLRSQYSMVPGLMALVLILPGMAIALGVTREKESGTFESLATTPIRGREYILGKLVVYLIMGLIGGLLALAVAAFWFRVPFRGDPGLYVLLTADYLFAVMGFSMFVASFVASQRAVPAIILLTLFIPSFFLTGLLLPIDRSSFFSEALAFALPSTHFIVISRGVALKGVALPDLWPEALTLFMMGLLAITATIALFSKKVG